MKAFSICKFNGSTVTAWGQGRERKNKGFSRLKKQRNIHLVNSFDAEMWKTYQQFLLEVLLHVCVQGGGTCHEELLRRIPEQQSQPCQGPVPAGTPLRERQMCHSKPGAALSWCLELAPCCHTPGKPQSSTRRC